MVPDRFRGAWQRISLSVEGGPWHEPTRAVWLQASTAFADLRIPLRSAALDHDEDQAAHPTVSFAGAARWDEPFLEWEHRLDVHHEPGAFEDIVDVGATGWEDGCLVVAGTFDRWGEQVAFAEMWEPLPGSDGATMALVRSDGLGLLVRCGDHAVTVVDDRPHGGWYRACYRTGAALGWPVALALGLGSNALPAPPDISSNGSSSDSSTGSSTSGTVTLDGGRWHVVERRTSSAGDGRSWDSLAG